MNKIHFGSSCLRFPCGSLDPELFQKINGLLGMESKGVVLHLFLGCLFCGFEFHFSRPWKLLFLSLAQSKKISFL